ncbi:MAG: AraC family transcriptional regulator [Actinomycetota bacterium]
MERIPSAGAGIVQQAHRHVLMICTGGVGVHHVDFTPFELERGTVLRLRPGQAHRFDTEAEVEADLVSWSSDHHPLSSPWYPSSGVPTSLRVEADDLARLVGWVDDMRHQQQHATDVHRADRLLSATLSVLLLLLDDLAGVVTTTSSWPPAYVDFREAVERRLYERPSVASLAADIGYSTRTIDRAREAVSGQTAKQVLNDRMRLELRRLLVDRRIPIAQIRRRFGYVDASNFAKFVRRLLGESPGGFRRRYA